MVGHILPPKERKKDLRAVGIVLNLILKTAKESDDRYTVFLRPDPEDVFALGQIIDKRRNVIFLYLWDRASSFN